MRTQKTFMFLLLLSFVFADYVSVSESAISSKINGLFEKASTYTPRLLSNSDRNKLIEIHKKYTKYVHLDAKDTPEWMKSIEILERDGYLNSSFFKDKSEDESVTLLKSAIANIQKNNNLKATGKLDQDTINFISKPRCGNPDIINGINTMRKIANKPTFNPWWRNEKKNSLTYAFLNDKDILDSTKSLFQEAFNRWSKVTTLNFKLTKVISQDLDILIGFTNVVGKGKSVGGTSINNKYNIGIIYLDKKYSKVNLESVVMHQIGHLLGLEHSHVKEAIMYPIMSPTKKIQFVNDDLKRIQQIYHLK
ncbi:metalloendoproteinase 2-MMP [Trifolium repens]|nr:metalloendoproteinase 2-MMP [Trifolium repens]